MRTWLTAAATRFGDAPRLLSEGTQRRAKSMTAPPRPAPVGQAQLHLAQDLGAAAPDERGDHSRFEKHHADARGAELGTQSVTEAQGDVMILTELLGRPVYEDTTRVGVLTDLRFVLDDQSTDHAVAPARLYGLLVSPHTSGSFLGYERRGVQAPWPIAPLLRWRERQSFLVLWSEVGELSPDRIALRPGFTRWSPELSRSAAIRPDLD